MKPLVLVIFGITGNLSQIKLLPALYDMEEKGLIPEKMIIIGNARSPKTQKELHDFISQTLKRDNKHHQHPIKSATLKKLLSRFDYIDGHLDNPDFYPRLKEMMGFLSGLKSDVIYYLATYPDLYKYIFENLNQFGMNQESNGSVKLIIEKPIGNDLMSAKELNGLLNKYFKEEQVFRLDHYLGKETLQNILVFRFGNRIFESLMNNRYVSEIQITASEDFGIGARGGYYDSVGALKDVGQNHLLQMLSFVTMDEPSEFTNEEITKKRLEVLKNLVYIPNKLILGQYEGYRKEDNIYEESIADTFFSFKTEISNSRWQGVPIYIRGGKKLKRTVTEIKIVFKHPQKTIFGNLDCGMEPNILTFRIQPNEGISLQVLTKKPGHQIMVEPNDLSFIYKSDTDFHVLPDPYEKLLSDSIRGDQTFFNSGEEVEAEWAFIDKLVSENNQPLEYKGGSWGPEESDKLLTENGTKWLE